jgi:Raf kinase inhibitor-like YbhB/YbcL family protein
MKKILIVIVIIIIAALAVFAYRYFGSRTITYKNSQSDQTSVTTTPMQIISPAFADGQSIPAKYTCDGSGVNPPLKFSDVPSQAKSLALVVDDPDAPGGDWIHWLVWDINPSTLEIAEGKVPVEATEGATSFGQTGYGGPCPPAGSPHHYHFKLYALDAKLNLPTRTTKSDLEAAINGHILAQAELVGAYQK